MGSFTKESLMVNKRMPLFGNQCGMSGFVSKLGARNVGRDEGAGPQSMVVR